MNEAVQALFACVTQAALKGMKLPFFLDYVAQYKMLGDCSATIRQELLLWLPFSAHCMHKSPDWWTVF